MIGKENMTDEQVAQNIETVVQNLIGATKRGYGNIKSIYLKLTMGSSVRLY
jgi:large subunit ribosomal protein L1